MKCAIQTLKRLKADILKDEWVNFEAQSRVIAGIDLSINRLRKEGFLPVVEEELNIDPLPEIKPEDLSEDAWRE